MTSTERRDAILVFVVVALGVHFVGPSSPYAVGAFSDDGVYTALGKALAMGAGYHSIFQVHHPVQLKYPPGLPLVLALFWKLAGSVAGVATLAGLVNAGLAGLAAALLWVFGRRELRLSGVAIAAFALSAFFLEPMLQYYRIVLSEPWLVAGWAGALLLSTRLGRRDRSDATTVLPFALLLGILTLFRTQALALLLAAAVAVWLERRRLRSLALFLGVSLTPEVLWTIERARLAAVGPVSHAPGDLPYLQWITHASVAPGTFLFRTVVLDVRTYILFFQRYLAPEPAVGLLFLLLLCAAGLVGAWRTLRGQPFLTLSVAAFIGVTLVWPFRQERLLLPALPFAGLLVAEAASALWRRRPRWRTALAAGLLAALALGAVRQVELRRAARTWVDQSTVRRFAGPGAVLLSDTRFIIGVSLWLRSNTPPGSVVMVDYPAGMYLYTGRETVRATPLSVPFMPSPFAVPGRYLASHMLHDSVSVIVDSGLNPALRRDLNVVHAHCPKSLRFMSSSPVVGSIHVPAYAALPDAACLRRFLATTPSAAPSGRSH